MEAAAMAWQRMSPVMSARSAPHFIHPGHGPESARAQLTLQSSFTSELAARGYLSLGWIGPHEVHCRTPAVIIRALSIAQLCPSARAGSTVSRAAPYRCGP